MVRGLVILRSSPFWSWPYVNMVAIS